ncbi:mRNA-binding ribosome synthesis protein nop7 [Quaeritorhiza haematococci]|nr:mRNA-binding ribosome synthesis protein nop7 [Quaeritorhiza haematococci]
MGKPKKKGEAGAAVNYISRNQAVKKLQISLANFRRLCILKGIYPREPNNRKKAGKGSTAPKTYYYRKDIQYLLHEPVLAKLRESKTFQKKLKKAVIKREWTVVKSLEEKKPVYKLDHIIRERYPSFVDALRDLDDALTMIFLFATLPAEDKIRGEQVRECQRLAAEFQAWVVHTHALRKVFVSIKGFYFQVEIHGQAITWIVPHQFAQNIPADVDFKVMGTFLELYTTLVRFVNYKLYKESNIVYPPRLDHSKDEGAAGITALIVEAARNQKASGADGGVEVSVDTDAAGKSSLLKAVADAEQGSTGQDGSTLLKPSKTRNKKTMKQLKTLQQKIATLTNGSNTAASNVAASGETEDDSSEEQSEIEHEQQLEVVEEKGSSAFPDIAVDDVEEDSDEEEDAESNARASSTASNGTAPTTTTTTLLPTLADLESGPLNEEAQRISRLFSGCIFFVSREVPRWAIEFVVRACGGQVGWDDGRVEDLRDAPYVGWAKGGKRKRNKFLREREEKLAKEKDALSSAAVDSDQDEDEMETTETQPPVAAKPAASSASKSESRISPFLEDDSRITHQIVDRPYDGAANPERPAWMRHEKREYLQPQWIFDCVNAKRLLTARGYHPGETLPPHLSPFVTYKDGDYVPDQAKRIMGEDVEEESEEEEAEEEAEVEMQDADEAKEEEKEDVEMAQAEETKKEEPVAKETKKGEDEDESDGEERTPFFPDGDVDNAVTLPEPELDSDEELHQAELAAEAAGLTYSEFVAQQSATNKKRKSPGSGVSATNKKAKKETAKKGPKAAAAEDEQERKQLATMMMSKKDRRLYERIQYSKNRKSEEVEVLKQKKAALKKKQKTKA